MHTDDNRRHEGRDPRELRQGLDLTTSAFGKKSSNMIEKMVQDPETQLEILRKNCVEILPENDLLAKLKEGRPLIVKFGCDPSKPDLHLGHAVALRKLREFQDLGHKVVLIVGDFTATIGDPTGRSKTRPSLSLEETRHNGQSYVDQAGLILDSDPDKLSVAFNSQWLESLSFREIIKLSSNYTVARMLEREDFKQRFVGNLPISLHEFLYPLVQAYDSFAIKADIEIGGTDQTFNLLVGRNIQSAYGLQQQVVITLPLIVGLDGKEKMSKSFGNYIGISEAPDSMYPKIMRVPDELLAEYFRLLTDISPVDALSAGPVEAHHRLAETIITNLHGLEAATVGKRRYEQVASGNMPEKMPELLLSSDQLSADKKIGVVDLIVNAGFAKSKGEARRAIQGRSIKLNGEAVHDVQMSVVVDREIVLQFGKNRFINIRSGEIA